MRQLTRTNSWSPRGSPRASPSASPQAPPWSIATSVVEIPFRSPDSASVAADLGAMPLFTKLSSAPDTTPTSVLEVVNAVQAAGWGAETRMSAGDSELSRERIDRELELEFEAAEQADRTLFASGLRPKPHASARGVPPNAPFMPVG